MKLYQTKNVLFYRESTMISRLGQLVDEHRAKYGKDPRRIYMTEKEWRAYEDELWKSIVFVAYEFSTHGYPKITKSKQIPMRGRMGIVCLTFRGIPVVRIEDWKDLIKGEL